MAPVRPESFLVVRVAISFVLLGIAVAFGANRQFYLAALVSGFFSITLASSAILYFSVRRRWPDMLATVAFTALLYVLDYRILNFPPSIMAGFSFFGLASLAMLGIRTVWADEQDRKLLGCAFGTALVFGASDYMASTMLALTEAAHPKTLDLFLYSFDASLRVQFSFLMGQSFFHFHWLKVIAVLFYIGLPVPLVLVSAGHLVRKNGKFLSAVLAFLITGPIGILFYNIFPAMGPAHILGPSFPLHPFAIEQIRRLVLEPVTIQGPRNAIPSLHMAWAILALWYSRALSWPARAITWLFVVFTAIATLGTGEHYLVDLVAALPFALLIRGICTSRLSALGQRRVTTILAGGLGLFGLLAVLRFGNRLIWISPIVPWGLLVVVTIGPILLEEWLERGEVLEREFTCLQATVVPTSDAIQSLGA